MKIIRNTILGLSLISATTSLAAEDFVFHCVDDPRNPMWTAFSILPVHPNGSVTDPDEVADPTDEPNDITRYQLVYFPKDEKMPRLIELESVATTDNLFTVQGSINLPGRKIKGLQRHLREGSEESLRFPNEEVSVAFKLEFNHDNITSTKAEDNGDVGTFTYTFEFGSHTVDVSTDEGEDEFAYNPNDRGPHCIRSGVATR